MPIEFRPSTPGDLPAIIALMQAAFDAAPEAPFLNPDLLRWKYFAPFPDWKGCRSYVLAEDGKPPIAHGCAWPAPLETKSGPVRAICLIDWASAKGVPGMGIMLARKVGQLAPVMLSIGGSEMTQQIMPKIGFEKKGELGSYARVLRPLQQFATRPGLMQGKEWLRLARNILWSLQPGVSERECKAIPSDNDQYLMTCPGAVMRAYQLQQGEETRGSVLLSRVGGQSRIVRLNTYGDRKMSYAAAVAAARRDPKANEVIALAPDEETRQALEANAFHLRGLRTVFVSDPKKVLSEVDYPLPLTMAHDDMFYLNTPSYPYLT